ncbi:patatin-like phospholipase RssA [Telmatospirillum sp.]|uniref:patatin-like phospholipase RssA n=1 Tax=Telmatospirillum sp. TaxID=2079197 RepID=UPI00284AB1E6|nr:patatin-like phospholipase RssA [Telmatospirillum sp.]MDR3440251.1 patatin-like phospholipase RssA [Telmatospirillum sp.]
MTPRIGIALGSGAARGWAHIGVLRKLQRLGIEPDIVCGTSIGSFVGAAYAGQRLDDLEYWARELTKFRLTRLFDFQFAHGGVIAGRKFMQFVEQVLCDDLIEDLPKRFACVCTDLHTGTEIWLQTGRQLDAVRASCALPGLVPAVSIDGRWLVDGALVNPVPVSVCRALGAHYVIAVNLNGDLVGSINARTSIDVEDADENALIKWTANLPGAKFFRQVASHRKNEPSILTVMTQSLNIVQDRISRSRLAGDPPDVIIAPRLGDIGILQFDRAGESISAGETAVELAAPALEEFLRRIDDARPQA